MIYIQNGIPIRESDRIKVEITPNEVILTNKSAERGDKGDYNIELINSKGRDLVDMKVNVRGESDFPTEQAQQSLAIMVNGRRGGGAIFPSTERSPFFYQRTYCSILTQIESPFKP